MAANKSLGFVRHHNSVASGASNLARAQAVRTYANRLGSAVNHSLYATNVGFPCSVCLTVGMGNVMSENNALSANAAFCHT